MSGLGDRVRRAREQLVTVGEFTFRYRRPTVEEMVQYREGVSAVEVLKRFVVGWDNVRECDIVPGGDDAPVKFDADAWAEWCPDRPDFWGPITDAITAAYMAHAEAREAAAKN